MDQKTATGTSPGPDLSRTSLGQGPLLALLVSSVLFNYLDRSSLSVAAPTLARDLGLDSKQLGLAFSSFFWSYAGFMIIAGWLVDRYNLKWVFGIGFFLWSSATLATGLVQSMASLLVLRLLMGLGQSISFPAYSKFIAIGFQAERRGLPNAFIDAGAKLGPAIATLIGGLLIVRYGWRALFFVFGIASLIWLVPWCARPLQVAGRRLRSAGEPGLLAILRRREAWGTFIGNAAQSYGFFFLFAWFPTYLVQERHLSLSQMAVFGSTPYVASAIASVLGGWVSDRCIQRGFSPTKVRKTCVVSGLLGTTLMAPAAASPNLTVCMVLVLASYVASGLFSSNHWAITQTLAGPKAAGRWSGLQNTANNLAGGVAPWVTGVIVAQTGSFYTAFVLAALIGFCGALSYLFLVREVAPVDWSSASKS
jgi:MFS family permease